MMDCGYNVLTNWSLIRMLRSALTPFISLTISAIFSIFLCRELSWKCLFAAMMAQLMSSGKINSKTLWLNIWTGIVGCLNWTQVKFWLWEICMVQGICNACVKCFVFYDSQSESQGAAIEGMDHPAGVEGGSFRPQLLSIYCDFYAGHRCFNRFLHKTLPRVT